MFINKISKFRIISFTLALFNPITATSYANEIICSNLTTSYLESRYHKNNFRLFFPPLLKITSEYIYLSDNKKTDSNISFVGHLTELRSRLLKSFIFLIVTFILCYYFAENIYSFLV